MVSIRKRRAMLLILTAACILSMCITAFAAVSYKLTSTTPQTVYYDGAPKEFKVTWENNIPSSVEVLYKYTGRGNTGIITGWTSARPISIGVYNVWIKWSDGKKKYDFKLENGLTIKEKGTYSLSKASVQSAGYDGSAKPYSKSNLIWASATPDSSKITISYRPSGTSNAFTTTAPTDAGVYDIKVFVAESDAYKAYTSDALIGKLIIIKAVPDYTVPTPGAITYNPNTTLADVALPTGWAWDYPATVPQEGTLGYSATFTPADTKNYQTVTLLVYLTVNAQIIITEPSVPLESEPATESTTKPTTQPSTTSVTEPSTTAPPTTAATEPSTTTPPTTVATEPSTTAPPTTAVTAPTTEPETTSVTESTTKPTTSRPTTEQETVTSTTAAETESETQQPATTQETTAETTSSVPEATAESTTNLAQTSVTEIETMSVPAPATVPETVIISDAEPAPAARPDNAETAATINDESTPQSGTAKTADFNSKAIVLYTVVFAVSAAGIHVLIYTNKKKEL